MQHSRKFFGNMSMLTGECISSQAKLQRVDDIEKDTVSEQDQ